MDHPRYAVKNLKTFNGHDGFGFEVSLYRDGKRLGTVTDDGWGGGYNYGMPREDVEALRAYAKTLPPHVFGDGQSIGYDEDMVVWDLAEPLFKAQDEKKALASLVRKSKANTVFVLDDEDPDEGYRYVKAPWSEKIETYLRQTYADKGQRVRVFDATTKQFRDL